MRSLASEAPRRERTRRLNYVEKSGVLQKRLSKANGDRPRSAGTSIAVVRKEKKINASVMGSIAKKRGEEIATRRAPWHITWVEGDEAHNTHGRKGRDGVSKPSRKPRKSAQNKRTKGFVQQQHCDETEECKPFAKSSEAPEKKDQGAERLGNDCAPGKRGAGEEDETSN